MIDRPLTVVIAPDSFKGSIAAADAARCIAEGWRRVRGDRDRLLVLPQADGGEGTLAALEIALPGSARRTAGEVTGPDGRPVAGEYLVLPDGTAVVELATVSGLTLMERLDPLGATTRGLGQLIAAARESPRILVALGGSATTEGGAGALEALGIRLLDRDGAPLDPGGGALGELARVDRDGAVALPPLLLLTDVSAPLTGPTGAAHVFGTQKGADPGQVELLDAGLSRLAATLGGAPDEAGAGAAGGVAYGLAAAFGARMTSGARYVAEATGLTEALATADVVLTGEGRFDAQSSTGKVVGELIARAQERGVAVGLIAGQVTAEVDAWNVSLVELAASERAARRHPRGPLREAGSRAAAHFAEANTR